VGDAGFDDTFHGAIGAHDRLGKPMRLQLGFAYDSSALTEPNRGPALPVDQQPRFAAGVLYDIIDAYRLSFAYEYVSLGSAPAPLVARWPGPCGATTRPTRST
jgi:long-chain fatty acid transport protein